MAMIDTKISNCETHNIYLFKRFIGDILIIWTGTEEQFLNFMDKINNLHDTIKFTHSYDFKDKSTTYLDMTVKIAKNPIVTDLYRKPTNKVQYLLPSSCHPSHIFKSIPYSLALRLVRICSTQELLDKRENELKTMLFTRKYNKNIINSAIEKAKKLDRNEILQKRIKK
jgi:peptide-methionine (R)-S-oxide reductase